MGQRVAKLVKPHDAVDMLTGNTVYGDEDDWTWTFYVLDATGNLMATYTRTYADDEPENILTEQPIYGSARIGMLQRNVNTVTTFGYDGQQRILGQKLYELSNHLGNLNAVISDLRIG